MLKHSFFAVADYCYGEREFSMTKMSIMDQAPQQPIQTKINVFKRWWFWLLIVIIVLVVLLFIPLVCEPAACAPCPDDSTYCPPCPTYCTSVLGNMFDFGWVQK
ncbi:hypothetical protein KKF61_01260 [Patescibacteria group bacterium]|nr:hypothetical protein [Patescibacteria group bacterium]MBU0964073.1 hypothetical protein [Patescibacteria group bacterium]